MSHTSIPELHDLFSVGHNQSVFQNFLSNIPFPIRFVIGCVIVVLVAQKFRRAAARPKGTVSAPCDVRKAGKEGEQNKLNEHHIPKLHGKREDMATDPQARLLAPPVVYSLCSGEIINQLKLSDPAGIGGMLDRGWGITDRESLIRQVYLLLRARHREDFAALRERCARPGWTDTKVVCLNETVDSSMEDQERCWRIHRSLGNDRGIQSLGFAVRDLIRATNLTRVGAGLG